MLFNGGPATGPWQQIGSVAEVTHPDAPDTASFAYREFWSDPEEENLSDALWDEITVGVSLELAALGEPVDRPVFDGAAGSEPFNAFAGVQDIDFEQELFTAFWSAAVEDESGVAVAVVGFKLDFAETVLERQGPFVIREQDASTWSEVSDLTVSWLREWTGVDGA